MAKRIALFWPGDARAKPNELALPSITEATTQLERALKKLGREPYRVPGFLSKPHEAIEKLGPIDDPLVGVCVHWFYGPHTTDGVVGKDNPLLLASNFSGRWPGLVGLLNTGACLESLGRPFSRAWTDAPDWTTDDAFMARLDEWCTTGRIAYPEDEIAYHAPISKEAAQRASVVAAAIRKRRVLVLMLGDTSMGMINGYFGPRLLNKHGFTEHKVDQAWIIDRGRRIDEARIDAALAFVKEQGLAFHWERADFDEHATREQLRDYLVALDLVSEFKADCLGWQYQLGLIPLRAAVRLRRGPLQLDLPPRDERRHHRLRDRGRPGQRRPDGDDEAPAQGRRASTRPSCSTTSAGARCTRGASSGCCSTRARAAPTRSTTIRARSRARTRTVSRRSTSRRPAALSPARACLAR